MPVEPKFRIRAPGVALWLGAIAVALIGIDLAERFAFYRIRPRDETSIPRMVRRPIKDTALASQIGVIELTYAGKVLNNKGFSAALVFGTLLVLYFVISYPLARIGARLEARLAYARHR